MNVKNRKLNVLSIGRNRIADVKPMVSYLKKFRNLQALCVHMNTFCKDDDSVQKILEQNQKQTPFPGSYDIIIDSLPKLKYLDWKPIDDEYRKQIQNYQNTPKEDGKEEINEEALLEERAELHKADLDEIIRYLESNNIETRPMLPLLCQPIYKQLFGDIEKEYPVAEWIDHYGFYVGCHHGLSKEQLDKIVETIITFVEGL